MVVVYEPDGGFVTGGGWFDSPIGAYTPSPSLTGRASFGFNSKYQRGATVPTGSTEFQFRVADFSFKSTSYDWLVVGGAKAQIIQKEFKMSIILQFFCCIIVSFLVWFTFGMILLSPQFGILGTDIFGPANTPISTIIIAASVVSVIQGSIMLFLILWFKAETAFMHSFCSFIATEILLSIAIICGFVSNYLDTPGYSGTPVTPYTVQDIFRMIVILIFWYLVLSLIFLIPSLIIGYASRKISNIVNTN